MIPGMFFVTWEDMGTHCDKVKKIVGIFFCNNTFVLALTTMEKGQTCYLVEASVDSWLHSPKTNQIDQP